LRRKKARYQSVAGNGLTIIDQRSPGRKKIIRDGLTEHVVVEPLKVFQFKDGFLEVDDPQDIKYLETHPDFNKHFFRVPTEEEIQEQVKKEIAKGSVKFFGICPICKQDLSGMSDEEIQEHIDSHKEKFPCDVPGCDYVADTEEQLQAHKASAHGRWDKEKKKKK